ncbi:MAG TPA: zf-HC2 domain-containing protein [Stackebrandtia sp.]|jgi:hypothetical protein|uniref:anti-sigma factor family protein n=1 Tax=Stackebrandtia sp. TaxID=2023065 RepID=UPI002D687E24|nr:zf-HC2 domain-containing protein [Stackebrandtia sp.]HZE40323.1 zf-HC2 domain-containing protein [Stackebrandtia sp.]
MSCQHQHDAAAYVLGALDPEEIAGFEEHLRGCDECRAEVSELGDLPTLLARAPVEDLETVLPEPPDNLLPQLVTRVNRDRRRRRLRSVLVAAAAVVCFTLAGVTVTALWPTAPATSTVNASLKPVATVDIWGTADLTERKEGTLIMLECDHRADADKKPEHPKQYSYRLVVTNKAGDTDVAGSWLGDSDGSTTVNLFTRWKPSSIKVLEVQDLKGHAMMRWSA